MSSAKNARAFYFGDARVHAARQCGRGPDELFAGDLALAGDADTRIALRHDPARAFDEADAVEHDAIERGEAIGGDERAGPSDAIGRAHVGTPVTNAHLA